MLSRLRIKNLALIDDLSIELERGLNVLTGETGAGKSIIIDAVSLLIGDRADKSLIQTGRESALVEGLFYNEKCERLNAILIDSGITPEDDNSILLMRQITQSGRNVCRINGNTATLAMLKETARYLLDIHGQHEHQSLLTSEQHIRLLDSLGHAPVLKLKQEVSLAYRRFKSVKDEIYKLRKHENDDIVLKDVLRYKIDEIKKANLKPGELEELAKERLILQNAGKITDALHGSYSLLFSGTSQQTSCHDQIAKAINLIKQVAHFDKSYEVLLGDLDNVYYQLQEISSLIRSYKDSSFAQPDRLDEVESRIALIQSLKRKYASTVEGILEYKEKMESQLSGLEGREEKLSELEERRKELFDELSELCLRLTEKRSTIAKEFREQLLQQLAELGMNKSDFQVAFSLGEASESEDDTFTEDGMDKVEFMISTNPGEPLKPLVKIVSGGEISRIMLALKTILAKTDDIPVLIFDEADVGISGRIAQTVAEKMDEVSKYHQVICVTHLPQIAAMADAHFRVKKEFSNNRTMTLVQQLTEDQRREEIAKMIGTSTLTRLSLDHAKELLDRARAFKNTHHL
jgi:DNA repair protein RecN (Recombination protein N)